MAMKPAEDRLLICSVAVDLVVVSTLLSACTATHHPKLYNLDNECHKTTDVDRSIIIKLYNYDVAVNGYCNFGFGPLTGDRVVARFTDYKMDMVTSSFESGRCEHLAYFLDGMWGPELSPSGFCGLRRPKDQYDLGEGGSFAYEKYRTFVKRQSVQLELLVTEVKDRVNGSCPKGFFDCIRNKYCIDESLTCNHYDDCGNDRDEVEGCGLTTAFIIGIICGVIGAFIAIVVFGVICFNKG